jgi:hypothetical protein
MGKFEPGPAGVRKKNLIFSLNVHFCAQKGHSTLCAQRQTHDRVMKAWHEEIEAMHREHCLITLTPHPRSDYGSARASRIAALDRLLTWVGTLPEVTFMRCDEIAAAVGSSSIVKSHMRSG